MQEIVDDEKQKEKKCEGEICGQKVIMETSEKRQMESKQAR